MKILVLLAFIAVALANVEEATTLNHIADFQRLYRDDVYALIFTDSNPSGIVSKLEKVFSGNVEKDYEEHISSYTHVMKVDTSKDELKSAKDVYAVPHLPYVQVYNNGYVALEEVPDDQTEEKIKEIVNIKVVKTDNDDKKKTTTTTKRAPPKKPKGTLEEDADLAIIRDPNAKLKVGGKPEDKASKPVSYGADSKPAKNEETNYSNKDDDEPLFNPFLGTTHEYKYSSQRVPVEDYAVRAVEKPIVVEAPLVEQRPRTVTYVEERPTYVTQPRQSYQTIPSQPPVRKTVQGKSGSIPAVRRLLCSGNH